MEQKAYTSKFAATRALKRLDAGKFEVRKGEDGKFSIFAIAPEQPKAKANGHAKPLGQRAQIIADAEAGKLPPVPDFSAETHKRFRPKLDELVKLVKAGDIAGLRAFEINPISTSPKAMDRYRNLSVTALEARAAKGA